jgi:hypothetical protein
LLYESKNVVAGNDIFNPTIDIKSKQVQQFFTNKKTISESTIEIRDNKIVSYTIHSNHQDIKAICTSKV